LNTVLENKCCGEMALGKGKFSDEKNEEEPQW
jgi:hypothetical protein